MVDVATTVRQRLEARQGQPAERSVTDIVNERIGLQPLGTPQRAVQEEGQQFPQLQLQPPEREPLRDIGLRFDLAAAGNAKEALLAFNKEFPEGDVATAPDGRFFFRENPTSDFRPLDAKAFEGGALETVADVVEFFGADIGALAGETAATLAGRAVTGAVSATPAGRGASLITALGRIALGAFGGQIAQESMQSLRGLQAETPAEQALKAGVQAGIGVGGAVVAEPLIRGVANLARGAGAFALRPGGAEAMRSAQRLGIGALPVNLVIDNQLIRRIAGQATAVTNRLRRTMEQRELSTAIALQQFAKGAKAEVKRPTTETLTRAFQSEKENILRRLQTQAKRQPRGQVRVQRRTGREIARPEVGAQLKNMLAKADFRLQGDVNLAYSNARAIQEPQFDVNSLQNAVGFFERGGFRQISTIREVTDPVTKAVTTRAGPERAGQIPGEIQDVLNQIKALDPNLPSITDTLPNGQQVVISGTDQLGNLREQLFDLTVLPPGGRGALTAEQRRSRRMAIELSKVIDETMDTPANINPKFRGSWKRARKLAKERFDFQETAIFMQAARSETPAELALRIGDLSGAEGAKNATNLRVLKDQLGPREFEQVQDFIVSDLLNDPFTLTRKLGEANPSALRLAASPQDIGVLRKMGKEFDRLNQLKLTEIAGQQNQVGRAVNGLVGRGDTAMIDELSQVIKRQGGKDSSFGRFMRAGIIDELTNALRFEKGAERVAFSTYREKLTKFDRSGALDFLTKGEKTFLNDVERVSDLFREVQDMGASLLGGQTSQQIFGSILRPGSATPTAFIKLLELIGFGRLMTSEFGRRVFIGTGKAKIGRSAALQLLSAATAQVATDSEKIAPTLEKTGSSIRDLLTLLSPFSELEEQPATPIAIQRLQPSQ
ncbi:MAG: hypothetical protein GY906_24065 [bacterium]|nr:hypothetical protein [bacterium]